MQIEDRYFFIRKRSTNRVFRILVREVIVNSPDLRRTHNVEENKSYATPTVLVGAHPKCCGSGSHKAYADANGLDVGALYETKSRLKRAGALEGTPAQFVRVRREASAPALCGIHLRNATVIEVACEEERWLGLAQSGEFGFVLLSFTVANAVIPATLADQLLVVVTLSMLLTPLLFIVYDKPIAPRFAATSARETDEIETRGNVVIAGHGRFGGIVNRILLSTGFTTVVLDYQSEQLEMLRTYGIEVYFGDAMRPDLLHAAGIENARMLVIAIDERESITELVR